MNRENATLSPGYIEHDDNFPYMRYYIKSHNHQILHGETNFTPNARHIQPIRALCQHRKPHHSTQSKSLSS